MADIIAVALVLEAENFTEDWEPGVVYHRIGRDPEDMSPDPQIMITKMRQSSPTIKPE
jgi:hypothetical protein